MDELVFYDFTNKKYIKTQYILEGTLLSYIDIFHQHNLNYKNLYFLYNFKILDVNKIIDTSINNIIIINKKLINNKTNKIPINNTLELNDKTNKYITLLQQYKDLITFIIILKTENIEYIILYLEKYKKKEIYTIIQNHQNEIIDMIESTNNFIDFYIRTCNINILQFIIDYSNNNLIITELENIFPDVPLENIEELIDIFS
tara:strand:+ start:412 stop:1017 length:606 start_codon:yes stop_codon:yes gene_type:complete